MEKEAEKSGDPEKKGLHLPSWVVEWGRKLLPYLLTAIVGAGFKLYYDNVGNMRDISRNTWWNQQQDERLTRLETRQDRADETITELLDNQNEFHPEVINRLQMLRDLLEKRKRQQ